MKRHLLVLICPIAFVGGLYAAGMGAAGNPNNAKNKITICHATGSESNPFVRISPDAEGVIEGHVGVSHQNGEDIIPPFDYYNDANVLVHFAGQNWNIAGQAIYFNDCNAVGTTTTTDTTPTVTVTAPGTTVTNPGTTVTTSGATNTVTAPSATVTVTTPGPTTTVTKVVTVKPEPTAKKRGIPKPLPAPVKVVSHHMPQTTG